MKLRSCIWFASLLFAGSATAWAATTTVQVGVGPEGMDFSPKTFTINAGDSVTFTHAGGLDHNVVADDNSFRCANGCDGDGAGGNGASASNRWSFTKTFNTAGTIKYYCETHGGPGGIGMAGSVTVNTTTPSIKLGGYLSGNWYNSAQGGHGFQLELTNTINPTTGKPNMLAIWFVYSPDGSAQNWIYSQGDFDPTSNTVTLPAALLTGAKFPPNFNPTDVMLTSWGTLTFTFSDCNTGNVSWAPTLASYTAGTLAITRLTQIAGTSCPQ
jgi:plastocyanin